MEVPELGPKALAIKTCPTSASSLLSQRDPKQGEGAEGRGARGTPSHPPCLLLTGSQAGDD